MNCRQAREEARTPAGRCGSSREMLGPGREVAPQGEQWQDPGFMPGVETVDLLAHWCEVQEEDGAGCLQEVELQLSEKPVRGAESGGK